jgi:hypothetical protein
MEWQNTEVATPVETLVETDSTQQVWPTFDHEIGLTEARELIVRSKRQNPGSKSAAMFTRVPLDRILAQKGCTGVRMYYGLNPDGSRTLIMVGVDEQGNDLDEGIIADRTFPCPPYCTMDSALDS